MLTFLYGSTPQVGWKPRTSRASLPCLPTKPSWSRLGPSPTWSLFTAAQGKDGRLQIDASSPSDSTQRQRMMISELGPAPVKIENLAGGLVTAELTEAPGSSGWSTTWTIRLTTASSVASSPSTPDVTRLTRPWVSSADNSLLQRPVYRVDIPDVTHTWPSGTLPAAVPVEPSTVQAFTPGRGWNDIGTYTPIGSSTIDAQTGAVTHGKGSFYYQDPSSTSTPILNPTAQNPVVLSTESAKGISALTVGSAGPDGSRRVIGAERSGQPSQAWHIAEASQGAYKITSADGNNCLDVSGSHSAPQPVLAYACHGGNNQLWTMHRVAGSEQFQLKSVASPTDALTLAPTGAQITAAAALPTQKFTLTSATATQLRLVGGWIGDTAAVQLAGTAMPALPVADTVASTSGTINIKAANSQTNYPARVVDNGVGAEGIQIGIKTEDGVVSPNHASNLMDLYNQLYYTDSSGQLITGLSTTKPGGGSAMSITAPRQSSPVATGQAFGSASASSDGYGYAAYLSTTATTQGQTLVAHLAVSYASVDGVSKKLTKDSTQLSYNPVSEFARLDAQTQLRTGIGMLCSFDGSAYTACQPDLGAGAMYRSVNKTVWLMTQQRVIASTMKASTDATQPGPIRATPADPQRLLSAPLQPTTGRMFTATVPADLGNAYLEATTVTANGTQVSGNVIRP